MVRPKLQAVLNGLSVFTSDILAAGRAVEGAVDVQAVHPLYLQVRQEAGKKGDIQNHKTQCHAIPASTPHHTHKFACTPPRRATNPQGQSVAVLPASRRGSSLLGCVRGRGHICAGSPAAVAGLPPPMATMFARVHE